MCYSANYNSVLINILGKNMNIYIKFGWEEK